MPSRFAAVTNKEISQLIKQAVPEVTKFGLEWVQFCLFDLNLSIKPVKNFFAYKCKLSLTLAPTRKFIPPPWYKERGGGVDGTPPRSF